MSNMPSMEGDCTAKHEVVQQNKQHWKSQWHLITLGLGKGGILLAVDIFIYLPCSHGSVITGPPELYEWEHAAKTESFLVSH